MSSKIMIIPIGWQTEGFFAPEFIRIEFTPEEIKKIKKVMKIVSKEKLNNATLSFSAEYFNDKECKEKNTEFQSDVHQLKIYSSGVYFYAQHKHDSSTQFESEEITLKELETGIFDPAKYKD